MKGLPLLLCLIVLPLFLAPQAEAAPYVVFYDGPSLQTAAVRKALAPAPILQSFPHLNGEVIDLTEEERSALKASHPDLPLIRADFALYAAVFEDEGDATAAPLPIFAGTLPEERQGAAGADFGSLYIALLDSGIDSHPEFEDRILFHLGRNCLDNDDGPGAGGHDLTDLRDLLGHGTAVAGILAGTTTGVAPGAKIIPCRIANAEGKADFRDMAEALNHLAGLKATLGPEARVIVNLSYNSARPDFSHDENADLAFRAMLENAGNQGLLFVASAGNHGRNVDGSFVYPTSLTHEVLLSVAAVDGSGHLASFSNYGQKSVEMAAPGRSLVTTDRNGSYAVKSGTSFAAPYAAAAASLAWALYPDLEAWEIRNLLIQASSAERSLPLLAGGPLDLEALSREDFVHEAIGDVPIEGDESRPEGDLQEGTSSGGGGGCLLGKAPAALLLLLPLLMTQRSR